MDGDTRVAAPDRVATNAASSGVLLERKQVKAPARGSDRPGLIWLAQWGVFLMLTGVGLHLSLGTGWMVPAMLAYASVLTVPAYALSHECAHGTAFRSRCLNELCLWTSSLIYYEEPNHRRCSHTRHHTHTWHKGLDSQMPLDTPMTIRGWLLEVSGIALVIYETKVFVGNALGRFSAATKEFTPASELPKLKWGARTCLAVYAGLAFMGIALFLANWRVGRSYTAERIRCEGIA